MKKYIWNVLLIFILGVVFGFLTGLAYNSQKSYDQGFDDGGIVALKLLRDVSKEAVKDTTKVQCFDFYVNKDTVHVPVWSKAIKLKEKNVR